MVELKNLKLESVPWLVDESSRLGEDLSKFMNEEDRLTAEIKVVFQLGTRVFD